jgi:hypothetical protein
VTNKKKGSVETKVIFIRLPSEYHEKIAEIAKLRNIKHLYKMHDQAILDFIKWRQSGLSPKLFFYYGSSNSYPLTGFAITKEVDKVLSAQADADGVAVRQVVLTAFIRLIEQYLR